MTNGVIYEGQIENGIKNGYGRMIYRKNKDKWTYYIGTFMNDMRHGRGILYFEDDCSPAMLEGEWDLNEIQ